ncbi:hypothetical protein [Phenylobacterium aquaticum]|uniref:hypothetical protein n=1 Tax=Phenylobacterium aquaticum TaxID=1763816 RepID=UPI001F5C201F|nr:hypothetical protein [Phenylobacterium aquaticum]MCI3134055.1 hypothetical protein [Phenylobacterium aquaticum]
MSWPANSDAQAGRHVFLVEMEAGPDALLRVLSPFALMGARVTGLDLTDRETRLDLRIEARGLGQAVAEHLGRRLRAMPTIHGVGQGWIG